MNKYNKVILWTVILHVISAVVAITASAMQTNRIIRTIKNTTR